MASSMSSLWSKLRKNPFGLHAAVSSEEIPAKISVRGLDKSFEGKNVLQGIDLEIERGESMAIVGRSGEGKSVLIKCILGLLTPDRGDILIDGYSLASEEGKALRATIGIVFQGGALFDSMNVWQNVAFRLLQQGTGKREAKQRAMQCLDSVELPARTAELDPSELSGGMRKRVAIARTMASEPDVLFFDEPTSGLDPITTDLINELIVNCTKSLGATAITITHDMSSVYKTADRAALLFDGRFVWQGSKRAMAGSKDAYVRQFVQGKAQGPMTRASRDKGEESSQKSNEESGEDGDESRKRQPENKQLENKDAVSESSRSTKQG